MRQERVLVAFVLLIIAGGLAWTGVWLYQRRAHKDSADKVGAALRLASAAQSWLERHEELHTSTVEHHQRMAAKADTLIGHAQAHRSLLLRILSRKPTPPDPGTAAAAR